MGITFGQPRFSRGARWRLGAILIIGALTVPGLVLASHQYTDVPDTHTFHDHIDVITDAGLTAGCGGGKFCPDVAVTRGQMAAFLNRLGALGPGTTPVVNADRLDGMDADEFMPATAAFMPATTYVTFVEDTFPSGEFDIIAAPCDDGDQLLSGGYFGVNSISTHIEGNFPHPVGQWEVHAVNTALTDDDVAVYALCADFAPLHEEPPT